MTDQAEAQLAKLRAQVERALERTDASSASLATSLLTRMLTLAPESSDDALFAHRERERGLAAYREAARMSKPIAAGHAELRANLRATFADPKHGAAARDLAGELGLQGEK